MRIGLLVIATNDYAIYLADLVESAQQFFFPRADLTVHLFTDKPRPDLVLRPGAQLQHHSVPSYGFPAATLYRYAMFNAVADALAEDYLYYCDVDCRFVGEVGSEALPDGAGLIAVRHRSYGPWQGTFETDQRSTAYTPEHLREVYCVGGFQGGAHDAFLAMSATLARNIMTDDDNGVRAIWQDESHFNRYIADHEVMVLSDLYCFPEEQRPPPDAKLLCLVKPADWQERNRRSTRASG